MAGRMDKDTVFCTFSCPFFERFLLAFFERFPNVLFSKENAQKTFAQKTIKKRSERFLHPLSIYICPKTKPFFMLIDASPQMVIAIKVVEVVVSNC